MKCILYLPFCKKLMESMLQIIAASLLDFITDSDLSPYNSFYIAINSSNFFRASKYFLYKFESNGLEKDGRENLEILNWMEQAL